MKAGAAATLRACAAITGSVLAFALLIERGGLMPATAVAALVASAGSRAMHIRDAVLLSVGLALAMALLFVGLLNQSFSLIAGL